jgi:colicin import membrane protein
MENQLAEITADTALSVFTADKGLDSYVQQVKEEVNSFEHDLTTAAGRAKTISLASKVAKIKVKYDDCGKDLVSGWKENAKKVDKARKKMRDDLDELKIIARKPVTDWEAEQAKIEADRLIRVEAELLAKEKANDEEVAILMDEKFDRDLADEKARLEAEAVAEAARLKQLQIDNDARIAKESAEAATIEAERLAQKAIDDAQEARQKAIDDKIIADRELLASQAREKLLNEQAAQEKINKEWLDYISEAYEWNATIDRDRQAKLLSEQVEAKRLADIELARQAEIKRHNDEKEAQALALKKLEDNKAHAGKILGEIKEHLMASCGLDEPTARKITLALRKTDRVTINY